MPDPLALVWSAARFVAPLVLLWLAVFFGRSLRPGAMPLIERIARQSTPSLPETLRRYTRRLTALWCVYFVVAAVLTASTGLATGTLSLAVWAGSAVLFVGERWLRPQLFPGEVFPGLAQQVRDTWSVWRTKA